MKLRTFDLRVGTYGLELQLRRLEGSTRGAPAILMMHGGNTRSDIYLAPDGGLAAFLQRCGKDVWLLDWRGSPHVVDKLLGGGPLGGDAAKERAEFTLDHVTKEDIPAALAVVRREIGDEAGLSLLGHCLSGGAVSMAVARGEVEPFGVGAVILLTFGLFCEVPWNGWLKAEDFILERLLYDAPDCRGIDPRRPDTWPEGMLEGYRSWPASWLPPDDDMLRHLSFMVGQPYAKENVCPEFRGKEVEQYFGNMHLGLYLHCGQIVRRGYVAAFNAPDVIDRTRLATRSSRFDGARGDLRPEFFRNKHVTLINAGQDRVWHRDSLDLMYEWLRNNDCKSVVKKVFPKYNLQELLWGLSAKEDVYPAIDDGISTRGPRRARSAPLAPDHRGPEPDPTLNPT